MFRFVPMRMCWSLKSGWQCNRPISAYALHVALETQSLRDILAERCQLFVHIKPHVGCTNAAIGGIHHVIEKRLVLKMDHLMDDTQDVSAVVAHESLELGLELFRQVALLI